MSDRALHDQVCAYYEDKLRDYGPTPRGVDWNSVESQELRFRQLARVLEDDQQATLVDYGCGYGALARYLRRHGHVGAYTGFDLSRNMIDAAPADDPLSRFTSERARIAAADYTIASGVFNVKLRVSDAAWQQYVHRTLADIASLSTRGFAFNALTCHADMHKRRLDLYYPDPVEMFEYCRTTHSPRVSLLHDYPLYEFTVIVRL